MDFAFPYKDLDECRTPHKTQRLCISLIVSAIPLIECRRICGFRSTNIFRHHQKWFEKCGECHKYLRVISMQQQRILLREINLAECNFEPSPAIMRHAVAHSAHFNRTTCCTRKIYRVIVARMTATHHCISLSRRFALMHCTCRTSTTTTTTTNGKSPPAAVRPYNHIRTQTIQSALLIAFTDFPFGWWLIFSCVFFLFLFRFRFFPIFAWINVCKWVRGKVRSIKLNY